MPKTPAKFDQWFNNSPTWSRVLLGSTPAELRDDIQRAKGNHESVLEFLLTELEKEGRRILRADLPSGMTEALKLSDLELASREPTSFLLTEMQENAVASVMRVFSIRNLLAELSDPFREVSEGEIWEQITLEAMQLVLADVRGDFRANLWPHTKRGFEVDNRLKENSAKGVKTRITKSEEKRRLCRDLAEQHMSRTRSISEAARWIGQQIRVKKLLHDPPRHSAIMAYISDLFTDRVKKKPATKKP